MALELTLVLSTSPRRRPCRLVGRAGKVTVASTGSEVGSNIFMASPSAPSTSGRLDTRGDRAGPFLAPAGQARGPAPGTAGAHDQNIVRRLVHAPPRRLVTRLDR